LITIKEEFVGSDKWVRAVELGGGESILMWLALKRYAAQHLTGGFVPEEEIKKLPGAPRRPAKALEALLKCGRINPSGDRGDGLVHRTEFGWQLHDYDDHANSVAEEQLRREKERERKRVWREQKAKELEALRSGRDKTGQVDGTVPWDKTGQDGTSETGQSGDSPSGTRPRAGTRAREGAHAPIPNPTQPNPTSGRKDLPPPPTKARSGAGERCLDSLTVGSPARRPDVQAVYAAWKAAFRHPPELELRDDWAGGEALKLSTALDHHGLDHCLLVAKYAPDDDMVSGRADDNKIPHASVGYIFGNEAAFTRILASALKRESALNRESPTAMIDRMKKMPAGAA